MRRFASISQDVVGGVGYVHITHSHGLNCTQEAGKLGNVTIICDSQIMSSSRMELCCGRKFRPPILGKNEALCIALLSAQRKVSSCPSYWPLLLLSSCKAMSPPPLVKQAIRILTIIFKTLPWQRLSQRLRSAVLLLWKLLTRTLYRYREILNHRMPKQPPSQYGKGLTPLDESSTCPNPRLTYTVIRDGDIISLHDISTSVYPFPGGSIRNTSRLTLANHSRPGSPNGRLTPSNGSVASLSNHPYSTSHSAANSTHDFPEHRPTGQQILQIERRDYGSNSRNPQRQDSEVPGILVESESPTSEHFTPDGPVIEEEIDQDPPQCPSLNPDPIFLDVPGGSVASSHTRISSRPSSVASNRSNSWNDGWDLIPTFPSECLRYQRRTKIEKKGTDIVLTPLDFTFETFPIPDGWTRYAHPEGCCYFYNESKRIYTDAEICDPSQLERIEKKIEQVEMAKKTLGFPTNAEVIVNIYGDGEDPQNRQYFCLDHDRRVIFFFHEFHANWVATWGEVEGAFSKNQLRYEFESQYWYGVQMYPHRLKLSKDMVDELRDIVLHLIGDTMSSPYSTSEFTLENLQKILSITSNVKDNIGSAHTSGAMCLLARFMFMLYHSRFLNFHGESYARIERNFSVYGDALYPRTWFLQSLSLLLFSAPDVHLTNLQKMWVDKVLHKAVWEETLKKFSTEWQELVTSAAILLNANVAFLAIQSVDNQVVPSARSWAQIISYASVVANVGGMILGLLLIRQYRNIRQETSDHVHQFLREHDSNILGLEALAVMFSLPYALLMWGMVSFLAAFTLMCVENAGPDTRITVGICLVFTGLLISWCIKVNWEKSEEDKSMDHRNLAYYGRDESDAASHVSSRAGEIISSVGSLSNGQGLSQPSHGLRTLSKAESVRSKPASLPTKPQPRPVAVFINAFRCIYTSGKSRNRREDLTASV
ncbi:hypothetical protein D9619_008038 [Psilocybe cf. subviscida]|uniref:WW domain-containing protein n=1 Tax=Psilocybe cf. subviscida TaxID=2480587 RepID=A0A8H5AUS7_9AGAR|nr:hypothetical protein D9619_008038 [Psilocybe cf. subviscida]